MKSIRYRATLAYYDGPQVIEAVDEIGGNYVGVLVDLTDAGERFLLAGVSPERLRQFRVGRIDLRALLLERPIEEWHLATVGETIRTPFSLVAQDLPLAQAEFLPEPGFFLHPEPPTAETMAEARTRHNLVMEIAVEPPEAAVSHRIRLTTFAKLLSEFQLLAKHAYKRALRDVSDQIKRSLDPDRGAMLDVVVPATPGSFKVVLEAASEPDLVGQSELARALQRIDLLFGTTDKPLENLEVVRENKGHLAGAYIRLLRLLVDSDTSLRYEWAEPSSADVHVGTVGRAQAAALVNLFDQETSLEREEVELVGVLSKADERNGTWRLETETGGVGGRSEESGPSFSGLTIGQPYRFICLERLTATERGTEQRTLYLVEAVPYVEEVRRDANP